MTTYKHYDESTADDFKHLFVERFPDGDPAILETFLANPARKDHSSTGMIAYDDNGMVKAILGLVPRRTYCGQAPLLAANGVAIAVRKDANRDFFSDFIRDSILSDVVDLYFVNTAIPPSRKRTALALKGLADGPESCGEIRERQLRSNGLLARVMRKALWAKSARSAIAPCQAVVGGLTLTCETEITISDFNAFWESYLKTNLGIVSSRTAEELRWVFGKGLASGEVVLITARRDDALLGYAFCRRTDESATCWRVVDLIALENDEKIIEALVDGTSSFLRKCTPAMYLQITGYPTWVQPLLKRLFPKSSSFGFNKCVWVCLNDRAKDLCGEWVNAPNCWYGCPYDGDMCLM